MKKNLYFIGLIVGPAQAVPIREFQKEMCGLFGVCRSLNSPPHITLIPPMRLDPVLENDLLHILADKEISMSLETNGISHFGDRVIFIDVVHDPSLASLREQVKSDLESSGIELNLRPDFHPHITIGTRDLRPVFDNAWTHFKDKEVSIKVLVSGPTILRHNGQQWNIIPE